MDVLEDELKEWQELEDFLERYGWTIECYSPFEIRHEDGSFATLGAANIVAHYIRLRVGGVI